MGLKIVDEEDKVWALFVSTWSWKSWNEVGRIEFKVGSAPSENDGWDCDFRFSDLPRGRRMEDRARVGVWRGLCWCVIG